MKKVVAILALTIGVAAAQQVPDNAHVTLDPDDNPDPSYRETLDGSERRRLEAAERDGETFLPYFYGSVRPQTLRPPEEDPPRTRQAAIEVRAPQQIVTTYERHGPPVSEEPDDLVKALISQWMTAPAIVRIAYTLPPRPPREPSQASDRETYPEVLPGSAFYGRILYTVRSDTPGPVIVEILEEPLAGAIATGSFVKVGERLVLTITRLDHDGLARPVEAWGVDLDCACLAIEGTVDRHWFERVLLPAALAFAGRWLEVSSAPDTTVSISGDVIIEESERAGTRDALRQGLAGVAGTAAGLLTENAPREATVTLPRNTELAVVVVRFGEMR